MKKPDIEPQWAVIYNYCGWQINPVRQQKFILDGSGINELFVPTSRLLQVNAAFNAGQNVEPYIEMSESGILRLRRGCWSSQFSSVYLEITHGYDLEEIPEVVAIAEQIAYRLSSRTNIVRESIIGASVTYATESGVPVSGQLLTPEKLVLDKYRLQKEL